MELASYGVAAVGIVVVALAARGMLAMKLAYRVANAALLRLTTAGNADRAEKLCQAAPRSYLDAVAAAIRAAKATGSTDAVTLAAASRPAFDAAGAAIAQRWRTHDTYGLVGVMLVGVGFALGFDGAHLRAPLVAAAGIALLAAIWFVAQRRDVELALASTRAGVLPALEQALAGTLPPPPVPPPADLAKLKRVDAVPGTAAPAPTAERASRPSIVEALAAPVAKRATASLRSGACPLCKHTEIREMQRNPGFKTYVCAGCGYTQEFAEL